MKYQLLQIKKGEETVLVDSDKKGMYAKDITVTAFSESG